MKNKGFFSLIGVILIILVSIVFMIMITSFLTQTNTLYQSLNSTQALYTAESGLEQAQNLLFGPNVSSRQTCATLNSTVNLTNAGTYVVGGATPLYVTTPTTLTSSVTSNATSIPVTNTASYPSEGLLFIDSEVLLYKSTSSQNFLQVVRGFSNTTPSSHLSGAQVIQYSCPITSTGYIPSTRNYMAKRILSSQTLLQSAWAVGTNKIIGFDTLSSQGKWEQPTTTNSTVTWNGVSLLNPGYGWAVGLDYVTGGKNTFAIASLNPAIQQWSLATTPTIPNPSNNNYVTDLYSVQTVSQKEAWAVGNNTVKITGKSYYTILEFNGTQWCLLGGSATSCSTHTIPTSNTINLRAVSVIDTNGDGLGDLGFAVGQSGQILKYTPAQSPNWQLNFTATNVEFDGVFIVSSQEAWAIGRYTSSPTQSRIYRWNGTSWSLHTSWSTNSDYVYGIAMLDTNGDGLAEMGWVVGNTKQALQYNGSTWTSKNTGLTNHLKDVAMFGQNDVWAVGSDGVFRWDSTQNLWTLINSGIASQLNSISTSGPLLNLKRRGDWKESF